jgi:zinc protease
MLRSLLGPAWALACLLALFPADARAQPSQKAKAQPRFIPWDVRCTTLPNGLTVVRAPFASPGLVAYQTVVRVGSRNEVEEGRTGFAHFFEHMMFRGTPNNPEGTRERLMGAHGFHDNAFTTDDFTVYHSYGPAAALEQLIALEADRFRHLDYSEPSFRTEALAVLGEYHKSASRPELKLEETLLSTAYTRHTYRHTTLGYYEDIKGMPELFEYSRQFFERWYTPDNTTLVIVGDFDDQKVMAAIERHYGPWQGKKAQVEIPSEPPQRAPRSARVEWNGPSLPRLMFAWHTPAARLDTQAAAIQEVLAQYLVGPTSELHKQLVLEEQLLESINSWWFPHRDPYLFTLEARLKDEAHRGKVQAAMNAALRKLVGGKVDAARVEAIKGNLRYGFLMGMESADQVAGQLAWYIGIYGQPDALERHFQNLEKVTARDLSNFAQRNFPVRNRTEVSLVVVPPAAEPAPGAGSR